MEAPELLEDVAVRGDVFDSGRQDGITPQGEELIDSDPSDGDEDIEWDVVMGIELLVDPIEGASCCVFSLSSGAALRCSTLNHSCSATAETVLRETRSALAIWDLESRAASALMMRSRITKGQSFAL